MRLFWTAVYAISTALSVSAPRLAQQLQPDIVFVCGRGSTDNICVMSPSGENVRQLTFDTVRTVENLTPRWSPHHQKIAFIVERSGSDVYTLDANGSHLQKVTKSDGRTRNRNGAWSVDGARILVVSTRDKEAMLTSWQLYLMRADGTAMQQLTHDAVRFAFGHPRWSPDGRSFVFHSNRDGTKDLLTAVGLYVIGADGSSVRRITKNDVYDGFADW